MIPQLTPLIFLMIESAPTTNSHVASQVWYCYAEPVDEWDGCIMAYLKLYFPELLLRLSKNRCNVILNSSHRPRNIARPIFKFLLYIPKLIRVIGQHQKPILDII